MDGAIHYAAGPKLLEECRTLGGCKTGEAKLTKGYRLPAKYVIHTVGPVWHGGSCNERALLTACYENSLRLAQEYGCESIAFPLISSGIFGYPKAQAMEVALEVFRKFLRTADMDIQLVVFDSGAMEAAKEKFGDIRQYIADHHVEETEQKFSARRNFSDRKAEVMHQLMVEHMAAASPPCPQGVVRSAGPKLEDILKTPDESFSQMLLRLIDESGMTDAETYKKANIDRKLFSKIRSNPDYRPKKQTVLAFAIALELDLAQTEALLERAGFALSKSLRFDLIIRYFIEQENYDIFTINEALFAFDQSLIGA